MALWRFLPSWWRRREDDEDGRLAALPISTRRFVTPLKVPNHDCKHNRKRGLVFLLAAESLSERSSADAVHVVNVVQPSAVIAQVEHGSYPGIRSEEQQQLATGSAMVVPSSLFGVVRDCFMDISRRSAYDVNAGFEVLRTIFGVTCHSHVLSAKWAALASNASFFYMETPKTSPPPEGDDEPGNPNPNCSPNVPGDERGNLSAPGMSQFVLTSKNEAPSECPPFASSVYSLLVYLQQYMPEMDRELQQAQQLLFNVEQGLEIDPEQVASARKFRLAKESLRVDLNNVARQERSYVRRKGVTIQKLEDLPEDDRGHVLMVQAIQEQARKHGNVVVVMDASSVGGIRKHWNTVVPPEVVELSRDCFAYSDEPVVTDDTDRAGGTEKNLAGSGAVAAVGIASLPWWASFTKVLVVKTPALAKVALLQFKRHAGVLIAKTVLPGGGKISFTTMVKSAAGAGKARAAAHTMVATAERATLSGVRTAFYCLMRKKQGMSYGGRPWLLLGSSVATGAGIIWWRDRLESAIESVPHAPKLARLGRGLHNLQSAAAAVDRTSSKEDLYRDKSD